VFKTDVYDMSLTTLQLNMAYMTSCEETGKKVISISAKSTVTIVLKTAKTVNEFYAVSS